MPHRNIILVGFMGTGKTSVGKRLARRLGMRFVDMDGRIEQRQGKSISRIFAEEGEPFFRALERAQVRELAAQTGLVVGTGGGIVLNPQNIADFGRTGMVVCLSASPETILGRVAHDTSRPLLATGDKRKKISELLAKRQPLYDAIPLQIATDGLSVDAVADRIVGLDVKA